MRYPVLPLSVCEDLARRKIEGRDPNVEPEVIWQGQGEAYDSRSLEKFASKVNDQISSLSKDVDRDTVEGMLSGDLYTLLHNVPVEVLEDPGFWRYLSLAHFWSFIAWREEGPFSQGNYMKYVNGRSNTEAVLNRMYLRAKAVGGGHLELAGALERSADFWRSHIIRVRTGTAQPLTRAFVHMQVDERLMTKPLREFAKAVNRTWSNVELHLYDEQQAGELLSELRTLIK